MPKQTKNTQYLYVVRGGALKAQHVLIGYTSDSETKNFSKFILNSYGNDARVQLVKSTSPDTHLEDVKDEFSDSSLSPNKCLLKASVTNVLKKLKEVSGTKKATNYKFQYDSEDENESDNEDEKPKPKAKAKAKSPKKQTSSKAKKGKAKVEVEEESDEEELLSDGTENENSEEETEEEEEEEEEVEEEVKPKKKATKSKAKGKGRK